FENPPEWTAAKSGSGGMGFITWETGSDFIMPGEHRTFVFYTPPREVASIWAGTGYGGTSSVEGPGAVPADGPKVVIAYPNLYEVDAKGLKVAKWSDAFQATADETRVQVKGPDAGTNDDFIDRDPDRFYVWVYDKSAWDNKTPHIQVKIS